MDKVRFGIVGLGNMGTSYLYTMFEAGKIKNGYVNALCDINPDKIAAVKEKLERTDVAYFEDYREMLDSGLVDAVMVETPHYIHPEIVIECLKRGINVICDKPAGVYAKQVREMNEIAKTSKAQFGMMFNQRTLPHYRKIKEMISGGELGELQRISWIITDWYRTQYYYDCGNWRATWAGEGGGVLINQCPHQIDLISWMLGTQPKYVNAFCHYGKWHDIEVEDDVTAYFEYENGATGTFITSTGDAPGTNRLEITGTLGKLVCEGEKLIFHKNKMDVKEHCRTATWGFKKPECEVIEVECEGETTQHVIIINNFIAALRGEEELFATGVSGINGVELMNAMELSGWRGGERITMPPDEDEYLAELNKRRESSRIKTGEEKGAVSTAGSY